MSMDEVAALQKQFSELKKVIDEWATWARRAIVGGVGSTFILGLALGGAWLQIKINSTNNDKLEKLLMGSIESKLSRADYERLEAAQREYTSLQLKTIIDKIEEKRKDIQ